MGKILFINILKDELKNNKNSNNPKNNSPEIIIIKINLC